MRPREDASEMPIRAQKTDAVVPIHSEYRRIIEAVPSGEKQSDRQARPARAVFHL